MKNRNTSTKELLEEQASREYEAHVMGLRQSVSTIKDISQSIKSQMIDDESLIQEVERGFDKNRSMVKTTLGKIDKLITSASSNTLCYVFLFVILVIGLLWKLTK